MASRNRNRQAPVKDDADEERSIWNQLVADGRRIDFMVVSPGIRLLTMKKQADHSRRSIILSGTGC
jgi:hypothetical protein